VKRSPFSMLFNRPMTSMEKTLLVIIVTYITIVAIRSPQFFSPGTFFDLFKTGAGFLILALGALIVFISGGIDVSSAAIAIVAGYSSVLLSRALQIDNLLFILAVSILIGAFLGSINALLIYFYNLPTLIVTLGTASVFHGSMAILLGMKTFTRTDVPQSMLDFGAAQLFSFELENSRVGLSVFALVVLAVGILPGSSCTARASGAPCSR
jgi:simple sugar transport system permease protein